MRVSNHQHLHASSLSLSDAETFLGSGNDEMMELRAVLSRGDTDVDATLDSATDDSSSEEDESNEKTLRDGLENLRTSKSKKFDIEIDAGSLNKTSNFRRPLSLKVRKFEKSDYIARRIMSATQERWNGYTVLPSSLFCLWYCLSGAWKWLFTNNMYSSSSFVSDVDQASMHCDAVSSAPFSLPPLPVMAVALGVILHAPFSFVYHWHFCVILPPGQARFDHWSRRLDQSFIHVASAFLSFGTSGSSVYFLCNAIYNGSCLLRLMRAKTATPVQTQLRILISMILYSAPLITRGEIQAFFWLWVVLSLSVFFFVTYPIRGWSHCAFHIVVGLAPPILLHSASTLEMSQKFIMQAAQCSSMS